MSASEPLPVSGTLVEYRGRRYELRFADVDRPYERFLVPHEGWDTGDFPEATDFNDDPADPWVAIGAGALDAAWKRTVRGQWQGCEVIVASREGERVVVHYDGRDPKQAHRAGFISSPYQYWHAVAEPADVVVTEVTLEPVDP